MTIRTIKTEQVTINVGPTLLQLRDALDTVIASGGDAMITEAHVDDEGVQTWPSGSRVSLNSLTVIAERAL